MNQYNFNKISSSKNFKITLLSMFRRIPSVSSSYASLISFFLKQKNIFPPYIRSYENCLFVNRVPFDLLNITVRKIFILKII